MKSSPPLSGTARRAALLGLLAALAVALSFLEGLLPVIPIPGAKLGLSNIVIMYALTSLNLPCALALAAVKAAFALLRGGTAFFMSLAGGLRLFRNRVSFIGVGILGAVAHNGGQLAAAMLLLSPALIGYGPWLLLLAVAAGTVTGLTLNIVMPALGRLSRG